MTRVLPATIPTGRYDIFFVLLPRFYHARTSGSDRPTDRLKRKNAIRVTQLDRSSSSRRQTAVQRRRRFRLRRR